MDHLGGMKDRGLAPRTIRSRWQANTTWLARRSGRFPSTAGVSERCSVTYQRSDSLDWLWVSEEGSSLGNDGIWQDINRLAERAGITLQDACHIFRRTFAANAVRQNIPRPYVQAVAGWSTPQMLDYYVAAMEAEQGAIEAFREFKPFGD